MKATDKTLLLNRLADKVDIHLQAATRDFQNLPDQILLKSPNSRSWSAAQCLEHLNQYGKYYLPQIETALLRASTSTSDDPFKSTWLGSYFTRMMDPESGKRKVKTFREYIPEADLEPHQVVAEFIQQQEKLLYYIRQARSANLNVRIPISLTNWIRLKLGDVLQFVVAHDDRHISQAKRALEA